MSGLFIIPLSGLKEGRHCYDFEINKKFFDQLEESEIKFLLTQEDGEKLQKNIIEEQKQEEYLHTEWLKLQQLMNILFTQENISNDGTIEKEVMKDNFLNRPGDERKKKGKKNAEHSDITYENFLTKGAHVYLS